MNLSRSILKKARRQDPHVPAWDIGLPLILLVAYFIARVAGTWFVASIRDEAFDNPSVLALMWGQILASILMIWLILQYVLNANIRTAEQSRQTPPTMTHSLALTPSRSSPLWLIWLAGLVVIVVLDNLALILGDPGDSLPLGLDRMESASTATWLSVVLFYLLVAPLVEGLLVGGLLYPAFAKTSNDNVRAVALATLPFVVFYVIQLADNDLDWHVIYGGLIYPAVLGLTMGMARAHSKSTLATIGCHAAFGLFMLFKSFLLFGG